MTASLAFTILALAAPAVLAGQPPSTSVENALSGLPEEPAGQTTLFAAPNSFSVSNVTLPSAPGYAELAFRSATTSCSLTERAAGDLATASGKTCTTSSAQIYDRFVDEPEPLPLSPGQKARLAFHNLVDPGNLATIGGSSAFTILTNSHTAYGPGFNGLGRSMRVGVMQDATGQFFGTWAIPALTGQDPRYHRMPHASFTCRLVHAVSHTFIAGSDTGRPMLNWSTIGTYPIATELGNLYVPGIATNGLSSVARILAGYATDPVGNLITEFLPDVARHVQVHVLFTRQVLNQVSADQYPALPFIR